MAELAWRVAPPPLAALSIQGTASRGKSLEIASVVSHGVMEQKDSGQELSNW